ncbi:MAG: hypothetical protein R3F31_06180 [Verrucomicrobiales bacterium]
MGKKASQRQSLAGHHLNGNLTLPSRKFLTEPVACRDPYEYSVPGADTDFTPQWQPDPSGTPEPEESPVHH